MKQQVVMVDIFDNVANAMNKTFIKNNKSNLIVNYIYGKQTQIIKRFQELNESTTLKDMKYPALILFMEFPERRGPNYYANIVIPKIVIATLTDVNDYPEVRYEKNFKPILYPIYYEFLHQLALNANTVVDDEDMIEHVKWDRMGMASMGGDLTDVVDAIEINNLHLTISQIKKC
jgi:hypothetical protein